MLPGKWSLGAPPLDKKGRAPVITIVLLSCSL